MSENIVRVDPRKPETKIDRRLTAGSQFDEGTGSLLIDAVDTNLMRTIALKVLREDANRDEYALSKMVTEAQIMAQLDHPNIIPVYELGIDKKKRLFFTMKKVDGKPFDEIIYEQDLSSRTDGDLFPMIQIMLKVCDAVSYAHSKGVLHRDLKPPNVMVGEFGQVYLIDWGSAHVTASTVELADPKVRKRKRYHPKEERQGALIGTPCYMSPEQAFGDMKALDERSDVFSLGAIIYEILTCTQPISGRSWGEMALNARKCEIRPPDERVDVTLPPGLVAIAMKAMKKDPAERYQSVGEIQRDLERSLEGSWHFPGRTYSPGELIVREGDRGDEAYIIRAGECQVFKTIKGKRVERRTMGHPWSFGETAIFTDKPRSASVEAVDEVTVAVVTSDDFEKNLGGWLGDFVRSLGDLFREADQRASDLEEELSNRQ